MATPHVRLVTAAAPPPEALLAEVLEIQRQVAWRSDLPPGRGFLATTWSEPELRALLDEGAYMATATDAATGRLDAYTLIGPIRHLPPGELTPAAASPIQTRDELLDARRFAYGWQIAVRRDPAPALPSPTLSAGIVAAIVAENERRGINLVNCVLEAPLRNERSLAFFLGIGMTIIGTLRDPVGPTLMRGPATWTVLIKLPLRAANAAAH